MNAAPDGSPVHAGRVEQRRATRATSAGEGLLRGGAEAWRRVGRIGDDAAARGRAEQGKEKKSKTKRERVNDKKNYQN
jgi:hypothetical protein